MKEVPLAEVKGDLSRDLRQAATEPVVTTRHGKPAGVLIGFASEEAWFDSRLENDPGLRAAGSRPPAPASGPGGASGSKTPTGDAAGAGSDAPGEFLRKSVIIAARSFDSVGRGAAIPASRPFFDKSEP
jgi:antitoxin (DNA-binding transcriptional repressor) of toxin-antitoxin stability system